MSDPKPSREAKPVAGLSFRLLLLGERAVAVCLALLLLRSAFAHLGNPYYFLSAVYSYQVTGTTLGKWVAIVLPYLQTVMAVCLIGRWWLKAVYVLLFGLFVAFLGAQWLALRQGLQISCSCFGSSHNLLIGPTTLLIAGEAAGASLLGMVLTTVRERRISRSVSGDSIS